MWGERVEREWNTNANPNSRISTNGGIPHHSPNSGSGMDGDESSVNRQLPVLFDATDASSENHDCQYSDDGEYCEEAVELDGSNN